jgi:hypothetical protein
VIYRALSDYDESRRQVKDAAVRPAEWIAARSAMDAAKQGLRSRPVEQARLQKEARRLERLAAILPDVAARELAQQQLAELTSVPLLPPSAPTERVAAVTKKSEALGCRTYGHATLAAASDRAGGNSDQRRRPRRCRAIEAIHHATTAYREASMDSAKASLAIAAAQSEL